MQIEHIYIACHRNDFYFTKLCVASIRYWHPHIPIILIKDHLNGEFDSREMEENWNVQVLPTEARNFGYGFSKLEALVLPEKRRYLMLDSDIVFVGPVLDFLNQCPADFIIHPENNPGVDIYAYDRQLLRDFDPTFTPEPFIFNAGQYVATSGLVTREDFRGLLEWSEPRRLLRPDIFKLGDQGLFNYWIFKQRASGRFCVAGRRFYCWANSPTQILKLEMIRRRTSPPMLLHWAGKKSPDIAKMSRPEILQFFQEYYHSRIKEPAIG